jgi:hypothetical protein
MYVSIIDNYVPSLSLLCFQVTECVQGLVDLNFGSYLYISAMTPLCRLFGDPCPVIRAIL